MHKDKPLMEVRGLSLEDVTVLIRDRYDDIARLRDMAGLAQSEIYSRLQADNFVLKILTEAPELGAEIIARAADQLDQADKAKLLPLGLQLKIMQVIVKLTLEDIGGPKGLAALMDSMTPGK